MSLARDKEVSMIVTKTNLIDCFIIEPMIFSDERGSFLLEYNKKELYEKTGLDIDFVQENQSTSHRGVLRGLHLQKDSFAQAKLVRVIKGVILDVVVDVREGSKTFGKVFKVLLSDENNKQVFIPRGCLHGFSVLADDTIVNYKSDNYYNKESESGVVFNDKDLNIDWKLSKNEILISEKDKALQSFKEFNLGYKI